MRKLPTAFLENICIATADNFPAKELQAVNDAVHSFNYWQVEN